MKNEEKALLEKKLDEFLKINNSFIDYDGNPISLNGKKLDKKTIQKRKEMFLYQNKYEFNSTSIYFTQELGVLKFINFLSKDHNTINLCLKFIYSKVKSFSLFNQNKELTAPLDSIKKEPSQIFNYLSQGSVLKKNFDNIELLMNINFSQEEKEAIIDYYLNPNFFNKLVFNDKMVIFNTVKKHIDKKDRYENIFKDIIKEINIENVDKFSYIAQVQEACNIYIEVKSLTVFNTQLTVNESNELLEKLKFSNEIKNQLNIEKVIISSENNHDFLLKSFNIIFLGKNLNNELIENFCTTYIKEVIDLKVFNKTNFPNKTFLNNGFMQNVFNEVYDHYLEEKVNKNLAANRKEIKINKKKI